VRRLHDRDKSGLWLVAFYVPDILLLVLNPALRSGQATAAQPSGGSVALLALLSLILLVVAITLLVFYCKAGTPGSNRYGPNPYGEGGAAFAAE
jgi:uncharacterized membrane protein YhaH (DUF805 family)